MKTIIVATDFSANATNALKYAAALAANIKARIVLYNAYQLPVHAANTLLSASAVDELVEDNGKRLEKIALATAEEFGITVLVETRYEMIIEALGDVVERVHGDLLVIGMHVNSWDDKMFGNTTTSIIRNAGYPVLVVPEEARYQPMKRILYAFDNSCLFSKNRLAVLKEVAARFDAAVQLFHVETSNRKLVAESVVNHKVELALSGVDVQYRDVESPGIVDGILQGIRDYDAHMLAMVPHKPGFWEGLLSNSKTRAMALRTQIPLLVLPNPGSINYN